MSPLFVADSYVLGLVSLPFAIAAIALGAVLVYALVMRGAPHLRAPMIVFTAGLLPYVVGFGLAETAPTDAAAIAFFRVGTAFVPLASTGALVFELALAEKLRERRLWVVAAITVAIGFLVLGLATPWAVRDLTTTPSGLRFFAAGPLVAPAVAVVAVVSLGGFYETLLAARAAPPGPRRRQLWGGLIALAVAFFGLVDVFLAYGIGYAPVSWFFVAAGTTLYAQGADPDTIDVWSQAIGPQRLPLSFPWHGLEQAGARLVFSSDWPASISVNPIRGIHNAVNRRTTDGKPPEGWLPHQRVSLETALKGYTTNAAFSSFEEATKGKIAPGMDADLIALSQDLFTIPPIDIHKTSIDWTLFAGRLIYKK